MRPCWAHQEADRIVAASRTFNALMRSACTVGLPPSTALRRAAEVAQRETGIDLLAELKVESHLAKLDAQAAAAAEQANASGRAEALPTSPAEFWQDWRTGQLAVPFQSCTSAQLYQAYARWCQLTGQSYTVRHTQFTPLLQRAATATNQTVHIKVMRVVFGEACRPKRILLINEPPFEGQGAWAAMMMGQFERPLQAFLAGKRKSGKCF